MMRQLFISLFTLFPTVLGLLSSPMKSFSTTFRSTHSGRQTPQIPLSMSSITSSNVETLPQGITKTVERVGTGRPVQLGDIATVKYACYTSNSKVPFAQASSQKIAISDVDFFIDGFGIALKSMKIGEQCVVRIPPELGYGAVGYPPFVPPNSSIDVELEVLNSAPVAFDFDNALLAGTPQTAADIAAAYQAKLANKAPAKEGFEGFLDKAKNFYFYGLFEGETGERPPWFLRPSITFPLAFAIVGAAFFFAYSQGAITERGVQSVDELDEIILSLSTSPLATIAFLATYVQLPL